MSEQQQTTISPERAADLARLQSEVGQELAAQAATVEPEAPGPDLAAEIAGLVGIFVGALAPALPSLATIYTPEATGAASAAIAAVCNKHGWMQGGMFGEWGEEVAAAAVLVPLGVATYKGVTGDIAAAKEKQKFIEQRRQADFHNYLQSRNAPPDDGGGDGGKTVTFGAAQPVEAAA